MGRVPPPGGANAAEGDDDEDDEDEDDPAAAAIGGFNPYEQPAADMMMGPDFSGGGPAGFGTKRPKFAFERQLKFKTADNGAMPERKVRNSIIDHLVDLSFCSMPLLADFKAIIS